MIYGDGTVVMIAPSFLRSFMEEMNAVHGSQSFFSFSSENDAAQLIKRVGGQSRGLTTCSYFTLQLRRGCNRRLWWRRMSKDLSPGMPKAG